MVFYEKRLFVYRDTAVKPLDSFSANHGRAEITVLLDKTFAEGLVPGFRHNPFLKPRIDVHVRSELVPDCRKYAPHDVPYPVFMEGQSSGWRSVE